MYNDVPPVHGVAQVQRLTSVELLILIHEVKLCYLNFYLSPHQVALYSTGYLICKVHF